MTLSITETLPFGSCISVTFIIHVGRGEIWTRVWTPVEDWGDPLSKPVQGPSGGALENTKPKLLEDNSRGTVGDGRIVEKTDTRSDKEPVDGRLD